MTSTKTENHGLNKVLTIQAKHPCNADNEILLQRLADYQFPFQLRLAVYIQRLIILAVRLPRLSALTIEHIVRADVGHFAVQFLADICNVLSAASIDGTDFCDLWPIKTAFSLNPTISCTF